MRKSAPALFGRSLQRGTTLWIDGLEKIIGGKGTYLFQAHLFRALLALFHFCQPHYFAAEVERPPVLVNKTFVDMRTINPIKRCLLDTKINQRKRNIFKIF